MIRLRICNFLLIYFDRIHPPLGDAAVTTWARKRYPATLKLFPQRTFAVQQRYSLNPLCRATAELQLSITVS